MGSISATQAKLAWLQETTPYHELASLPPHQAPWTKPLWTLT